MSITKNLAIYVAAGLMAIFSGVVMAAQPMAPQQMMPGPMMQQHQNRGMNLQNCQAYQQLSSSQKTNLDKVIAEYKKAVTPIKQQLFASHMALEQQLNQAKVNEKSVNELVSKISSLRNQIFAERIQARVQMVKLANFNPAVCIHRPAQMMQKSGSNCVGNVCLQPIPQVAPQAGVQNAPQQGVQTSSQSGMQNSQPQKQAPAAQQQTTNGNTQNNASLWQ